MKRKLLAFAGILVMTLGLTVAVGSPAFAVGDSCPSNAFCIWDNSTYSGTPDYYWTTPPNGCTNIQGALNDETNSAKLGPYAGPDWTSYAILYEHQNCTGDIIATATNGTGNARLVDCKRTYNPWNTYVSGCSIGDVSSFFWHD